MPGLTSLATLEGAWTLDRHIVHSDGTENRFRGTAVFRRSGHRLIQEEEGELSMPGIGKPIRATRSYIWSMTGNRLECAFPENRPFHTVPLNTAHPETTYLCPPDRYHVAYDFSEMPRWRSVWTVEGPRKDYVMTSEYVRPEA